MFKITLSIVLIVEGETEAAVHNKVMDCKSNEIFCYIPFILTSDTVNISLSVALFKTGL